MRVWLTGSSGMLGTAVLRRLEQLELAHEGTGRELDIGDLAALRAYADGRGFSHVINCAAYTAVDDAESHEDEALRVNGVGVGNLAQVAQDQGASLLHVSTDYVFDGRAHEPYREDAACAPLSAYGRSKLAGERAALATLGATSDPNRSIWVVRTSWLFGEGGRNFVTSMLGLMREREPLHVVTDQRGRPTYTHDLADAMLRLAGLVGAPPAPSGIYHFANRGETNRHGFARAILQTARAMGIEVATQRIEPTTSSQFPRPAARPAWSVLDTTRIEQTSAVEPRAWQQALADYMRSSLAS